MSQFHVVQPQLPVHTCAISQIHIEPRIVLIVEAVEEFLWRLQAAHTCTAFPERNVRPEVVGTLQAACQVEEFLIVVTSFVHHSPEVTTIVILTTFSPFLVTESGADSSDECTIREGIKSGSVGVEHQAVETSCKLFWTEVFLFQFVHPVPFTEHSGDTLVFTVINPVSLILLLFHTTQTKTVNGVFRLQTNHIVIEETILFQITELVPILILHFSRVKISISATTFHVNANFRKFSVLQIHIIHHIVDVEVTEFIRINCVHSFVKVEGCTRLVLALHEFGLQEAFCWCVVIHEKQNQFLLRDSDTRWVSELRVLSEVRRHQFVIICPFLRMTISLILLDAEIFLIFVCVCVLVVPRVRFHAQSHFNQRLRKILSV